MAEPTKYVVICQDDRIRHSPFNTRREADAWANWGHACTNRHIISEADRCEICDELIVWESPKPSLSEAAEMYDPAKPGRSYIVHGQCGLDRGLEIA
jgi:hypothetical protein